MAKGTHSKRVERERVVTPAARALFDNRVPSFTGITVSGFKSIREQIRIELRPLLHGEGFGELLDWLFIVRRQ